MESLIEEWFELYKANLITLYNDHFECSDFKIEVDDDSVVGEYNGVKFIIAEQDEEYIWWKDLNIKEEELPNTILLGEAFLIKIVLGK